MADFTGMMVSVTLKNPENLVLEGKVLQIIPGQTLALSNVVFPQSGGKATSWTVRGADIADIRVVDTGVRPTSSPPRATPTTAAAAGRSEAPTLSAGPLRSHPPSRAGPPASVVPVRTAHRQPSEFVDPAILSYGRSPAPVKGAGKESADASKTMAVPKASSAATPSALPTATPTSATAATPPTPVKSMLAKAAENLPSNSSPFNGEAGKSSSSRKPEHVRDTNKNVDSRQASTSQVIPGDGTQEAGQNDTNSKKKVRRGQKKKGTEQPPPVMNFEVFRNGNDMSGSVRRGKGWRQTPLLQPSPQSANSPQLSGGKKKSRREIDHDKEVSQNGWATEDVTDIQELEEFDFEANHRLFDKKSVFEGLRMGDTTADEDRLVGHNKVPARPGTYGGKNLHPTENVLSPSLGPKLNGNGNELDSTSDADTELNFAANGGRSSSRHSATRTTTKKQPSRQNSNQVDPKPHPLSASMSSDRAMSRSRISLPGRTGKSIPSLTTSPMPDRTQSPHSALSTTRTYAPSALSSRVRESHLAIYPSMTPCPVLHPSALETLEAETISRYGLTSNAITESAARCIAETAMSVFHSTSSSRRGSRANTLRGSYSSHLPTSQPPTFAAAPPVVVIIAGNHAIGARAVAAARHLVSRKTQIILAEAQYESSETQSPEMKTQTAILKRMAKSGAAIKRGPWRRATSYIKNLPSPPAVIIDALLAGSTYESLLDTSNTAHGTAAQSEVKEMIEWANRSRAPVLSIGCPSGVSGLDGETTVMEGEPLAVRPAKVLCLAAPMQGVLDALKGGERWDVSLGDVGVNIALRAEEAVAFGGQWAVEVRFLEEDGVGEV